MLDKNKIIRLKVEQSDKFIKDMGDGSASINIYKDQLKSVLTLREHENGGFLRLHNNTDEQVVLISAVEDGNGTVSVFDRKGKVRTLTPNP